MRQHLNDIDFPKAEEYERRFRHDVMAHIHTFADAALDLAASLAEEGTHTLVLRLLSPDGTFIDGPATTFVAHPPPAPPRSATAVAYDSDSQTLTLQIER